MALDRTTVRNPDGSHIRLRVLWKVTGPTSYSNATGIPASASQLGLGKLEGLLFPGVIVNASGAAYAIGYDWTAAVFRIYGWDGVELNTGDLSGYVMYCEALGT